MHGSLLNRTIWASVGMSWVSSSMLLPTLGVFSLGDGLSLVYLAFLLDPATFFSIPCQMSISQIFFSFLFLPQGTHLSYKVL